VEENRSRIGRVFAVVMVLCLLFGVVGGAAAFGAWMWDVIPSHALAALATVLGGALFLVGLFQDED
jgi:hypothetical protein